MVASTSIPLKEETQKKFINYYRSAQMLQNITRNNLRSRFETIDRSYMREQNTTLEQSRAQAANKAGDPTRYQDMTVPVVMPQVEAAVTHQSKVFLTGDPLFGVVSAPEFINEALQMETVIENDSIRGGWARELILFFRDGFKYNWAPIEMSWAQQVSYTIDTDLAVNLEQGEPKRIIWTGSRMRRLDPYNTFIDTRVPPSEFYRKGEFGGFTEMMSRIELKSFIAELPAKIIANIVPAFESGRTPLTSATNTGAQNYYLPQINPFVSGVDYKAGTINWLQWAGLEDTTSRKIDYKDAYEVTTLYARILPSEFELVVANKNTPQIYKLIIVNHQWIIYAELQTNAHNSIPILIGQPLEDGLTYQTKSLATNGAPFQDLATAYMASIIASRRRAISDRTLYDPSRVTRANINAVNPAAKIPVRSSAYGKNVSDAVWPFPYREDQQGASMQQIQTVFSLANILTGQNPVRQGEFIKGNKTNEQFDQVMDNSTGRDQLSAIMLEYQVFVPMKEIIKINILQFQGGTTLYNRDKRVIVEVDPIKLRKAVLEFRISDGLVPSEKILSAESFAVAVQSIATSPELGAGYNLPPMFSYIMKTQGADLSPFEKSPEQIAYEQALQSWQTLAQIALEKGFDPEAVEQVLPPMPLPEQFGYVPAQNDPATSTAPEVAPVVPRVGVAA